MVTTLIKHEALRTRSWLGVVFGVATLMTLAGALMELTPWRVVQILGFVLTLVPVFAFLLVVQVGLAFDYWRSSYSKTGYFTQSLPVKGSTIYWSKLLWGALVSVMAAIWTVGMGLVALAGGLRVFDGGITFRQLISELWGFVITEAPTWALVVVPLLVILSIVGGLAQYYFAASIGSEGRINRLGLGGPVLVYFGLYMVLQVVLFIGIVAIPLGLVASPVDGSLEVVPMDVLGSMFSSQDPDGMPLGFLPVLFLATAALIWRSVVSWNKKVSLA